MSPIVEAVIEWRINLSCWIH